MGRIGWENNQGAYFINKLSDEINTLSGDVNDIGENLEALQSDLGDLEESVEGLPNKVTALENAIGETKVVHLGTISPSASMTCKAENFTKILLISFAGSGDYTGAWNILITSTGTTAIVKLGGSATYISISSLGNGRFSINNTATSGTSTGNIYAIILTGSVEKEEA